MTPKIHIFLFLSLITATATAQIPGDITLDPAFGGATFSSPVAVRHAGDGSDRKFIVQKGGRIRIVDANGSLLGDDFLNISSITESNASERGLLGMAFHPDFSSNGLVYVEHNAENLAGITTGDTVVAEYQVSAGDPDQLDPATRRVIIVVPQDFNNHNGGDLHFGPDGYLYIGMGDGGDGNDPCNRGQTLDPSTTPAGFCRSGEAAWLLGKMIRIDVDNTTPAGSNNLCAANGDGSAEYAVPANNPFVGESDRCGEVWSYGHRNPYRFSFDRDTGDMWIGDVGQSTWEEINLEPVADSGGRNYGWKVCEGDWLRGSTTNPCTLDPHAAPVIEYRRTGGNCAVTGGFRYRGPILSMQGYYVFGDYCAGDVRFASEESPGSWESESFGSTFGNPSGFGEDEQGNLYVTLLGGQIRVFNGDTGPADPIFADRFEQ